MTIQCSHSSSIYSWELGVTYGQFICFKHISKLSLHKASVKKKKKLKIFLSEEAGFNKMKTFFSQEIILLFSQHLLTQHIYCISPNPHQRVRNEMKLCFTQLAPILPIHLRGGRGRSNQTNRRTRFLNSFSHCVTSTIASPSSVRISTVTRLCLKSSNTELLLCWRPLDSNPPEPAALLDCNTRT